MLFIEATENAENLEMFRQLLPATKPAFSTLNVSLAVCHESPIDEQIHCIKLISHCKPIRLPIERCFEAALYKLFIKLCTKFMILYG